MSGGVVSRVALALLAVAVLGLRVAADFAPSRAIVVRAPAAAVGGRVDVPVPPTARTAALDPPFALIARARAGAGATAPLAFELDGQPVCERTVPAGEKTRLDCVVAARAWDGGASHLVTITGPPTPWALEYLELASHHGGTSAPFRAFVVPRDKPVRGVGWVWFATATIALAALLLPGLRRQPSRGRLQVALWGVIALTFGAVLISPWVSDFKVVLTPLAWLLGSAPLVAPELARTARLTHRGMSARARRLALAGLIVAIVGWAGARIVNHTAGVYHGGNVTGLVQIAESRFNDHPALRDRADLRASLVLHQGTGYDAQFMFFAAFDPLLRSLPDPREYRAFIDAPPYRYPRAGLTWLTKLASLDREIAYAPTMVWLVVAGFAATAAALAAIAMHSGASPLWGLAVLAIPGMWRPLTLALPEPIAAALIALAVLCLLKERWIAAALCLAAAVLMRETTALLLLVAAAFLWKEGKRGASAWLLAALAPYLAWRGYVGWMLYPDWGLQAFAFNPHAYDLPVKPFVELFAYGAPHPNPAVARASLWFAGILVGVVGSAFALARYRPSIVSVSAAVYGLMALALDRDIIWTHVANVERTTYELFLLLAIAGAMTAAPGRRGRWGIAAFCAAGVLYVMYLSFDGVFMREALFGG
jgi:hypothetical protein